MKLIPNEHKKNGYYHKLICRTDIKAIYELSNETDIIGYEVHKIRFRAGGTVIIGGKSILFEDSEILASNEDFGSCGWAYKTKEAAIKKYDEI